jgi:hypothetical protein
MKQVDSKAARDKPVIEPVARRFGPMARVQIYELTHLRKTTTPTGRRLGEEAARGAKTIQTHIEIEGKLKYTEDILKFHLRWEPEEFREGLVSVFGENTFIVYEPKIDPEIELPVSTLLKNKRIAVMTMPGEPFMDFQIDWQTDVLCLTVSSFATQAAITGTSLRFDRPHAAAMAPRVLQLGSKWAPESRC